MRKDSGILLEAAAPYVRHFRGRTFVVKLSGEVLESPAALDHLAWELSVVDSLGVRLVLVHGGGSQAGRLAERLGVPQTKVDGRRITDQATLEVVTMAFAGTARHSLLAALRRHGVSAVGLSGLDAGLTRAVRRPPVRLESPGGESRVVDFGFVGDIQEVRPGILEDLLRDGHTPVVTSLAGDDDGQIYNVNADTLAAAIAARMKALKLVFLTGVPGVLRDLGDPTSLISSIQLSDLAELRASGVIQGGMLPKLDAAASALEAGVERAHIVSGLEPHALLRELFTNEGSGTLLLPESGGLPTGVVLEGMSP